MKRAIAILAGLAACAGGGLAQAQDAGGPPPAAASQAMASAVTQWRTVPAANLLIIDTNRGRILVEMAPEVAPLHVERIRLLARAGFFDGLTWHRVIDWFMAQTGDPLGNGEGQSPYPDLAAEFTFRRDASVPFTAVAAPAGALVGFMHSLPVQTQPDAAMALTADGKVHGWGVYCPGVAGMARDEGNDTANSQFFLMRQAYPALDKRYTVWGTVVSGLDVVRALKSGAFDSGMVTDPDRMLSEQVRQARGADFSVCDITLPVDVSQAQVAAGA